MITCLQPVRSGKLPYGAIAQLPDARPSLFFFSWGARLVPCLSAALRISRRPYRPRPRWVGWQTTSRLADWQTGTRRASKGYVPLVCSELHRRNSFLTGGEWRSASLLRAKPFCLSTPSQASGLHALELHLAVTQMSLRFPRVGSLCHTPSSPSQS